jgi:hypothetical protein
VSAVHRHNLHALAVELNVCIRQDILDSLHSRTKGGSLDGADAKQVVGVHSTATL